MNRKKKQGLRKMEVLVFFTFFGEFLKEKLKFLIGYVDMEIE